MFRNLTSHSAVRGLVSLAALVMLTGADCASETTGGLFPAGDTTPVAHGGSDQTVEAGARVILDAGASTGGGSDGLFYSWQQVAGDDITLKNSDTARATFTAPDVSNERVVVFVLAVQNAAGVTSTDEVAITIQTGNRPPEAYDISAGTDEDMPSVTVQLSARDPDGDIVSYQLAGEVDGQNLLSADLDAKTGSLVASFAPGFVGSVVLPYRVSDGALFSNTANITIESRPRAVNPTGVIDVDPETYAGFEGSDLDGDVFGETDMAPTLPQSVDLSPNFPTPGDQGGQGSCVGWATAYACKSYQERREIGWALDTPDHLFSPAFVYNQINGGKDGGSKIPDALTLAVSKGISTLATMPYSDTNHTKQPSAAAKTEAAGFKARRWSTVQGTTGIKTALANGRPAILSMKVYDAFDNIVPGPNAVYNSAAGPFRGGHAVTVVGYNNAKFGGSFKIINSWGTDWGDQGFFYLPYSMISKVVREAYVLEDAENTGAPTPPPAPTPATGLPNLQITSWSASYDPRPGGLGTLKWRVTNAGQATAPANAKLSFMLSTNETFSSSDTLVMYERIPFQLTSGHAAYRDEANAIQFRFPQNLASGTYHMALWIDDETAITESNENDNISRGEGTVTITNTRPDLTVRNWYVYWNTNGAAQIEYKVANDGASTVTSTAWRINVVLSPDETIGNGNERYIFTETAGTALQAGYSLNRGPSNRGNFNLLTTTSGASVPAGQYYMAVWVDDQRVIDESNESNNASLGQNMFVISNASAARERLADDVEVRQQFNGRVLPSTQVLMQRVEVVAGKSGREFRMMESDATSPAMEAEEEVQTKCNASETFRVFPQVAEIAMP